MKGLIVRRASLPSSIPVSSLVLWISLLLGLATVAKGQAANSATRPNEGDALMYHGVKVNRVLFLGNSITLHGPAPTIGWSGNWGMAASTGDKDYVHLVLRAIAETAGKEPLSRVANIADFERRFESYDIDTSLRKDLAFKADLIIVAIGENVPALTTEHQKVTFKARLVQMLTTFRENGSPVIVVRSCFWPNRVKDSILEEACKEVGGLFVDMSPLGKDAANRAGSERKFSHQGVASHPGDRGMKAIADAILKALRKGSK